MTHKMGKQACSRHLTLSLPFLFGFGPALMDTAPGLPPLPPSLSMCRRFYLSPRYFEAQHTCPFFFFCLRKPVLPLDPRGCGIFLPSLSCWWSGHLWWVVFPEDTSSPQWWGTPFLLLQTAQGSRESSWVGLQGARWAHLALSWHCWEEEPPAWED